MARVIVTGVASGNIGHAAAIAIGRRGYDLMVTDSREIPATVVDALACKTGRAVEAFNLDICDTAATKRTIGKIAGEHSDLYGLVNSAGIARPTKPLEITPDEFDLVLGINLKGTFFMCQAFIQGLVDAGRCGSVVNLASMVGKTGGKNNGLHYAASKAGIISITKGFARAFGGKGIRVNAVAPGIIDTSMSRGVPGSDEQAKKSPLGRWGTATEVGSVIAFLVSEESSYMTGAIVDVNGGVL